MSFAEDVAMALRGKPSGNSWICPCPAHDDRNPSLSISETESGRLLIHCFAGCDYNSVMEALASMGLTKEYKKYRGRIIKSASMASRRKTVKKKQKDWSDRAEDIWKQAVPIKGTLGEKYLHIRGCHIPECNDLRYLHNHSVRQYHCLVARITDAVTGEPISLHFTYLDSEGTGKAFIERPKELLYGHRSKGGVIRLTYDDEVTMGLGIAEGIETALACAKTWQPVWAAINSSNIASLPILNGIESLTIFSDNDKAGLKAAEKCAWRWSNEGKEVRIVPPSEEGTDWADLATEEEYET